MKFLLPNYSCLQNPWPGSYRPQIPVLSVLCPQQNLLNPPPPRTNFLGTPLRYTLHSKSCASLNHSFWTVFPNLVVFLTVFLRTKKILFLKHCVLVFLYTLDDKRHHNTACFQMWCTFARMHINSAFQRLCNSQCCTLLIDNQSGWVGIGWELRLLKQPYVKAPNCWKNLMCVCPCIVDDMREETN